jgi:xanthine dehydrogenase small subunit
MIQFILNNETLSTNEPAGLTLLDFIRYKKHLKGTKIGCREGDCGACTILVGELKEGIVHYRSMTSCLTPLANVQGKHVVTVEGINRDEQCQMYDVRNDTTSGHCRHQTSDIVHPLTPVQTAMVEESGTQCGFCTVGFVMSLTGLCLENQYVTQAETIESIDGNICRCTGYKSIERAAQRLTTLLQTRDLHGSALDFAIENHIVPAYFSTIKTRLTELKTFQKFSTFGKLSTHIYVGGGTDLYVQKHDSMTQTPSNHLFDEKILRGVNLVNGYFEIGGAATVSDLKSSSALNGTFPFLQQHLKLVSSTPIRNMATIGGNLVNASPIGDLTVFFLALDATIELQSTDGSSVLRNTDDPSVTRNIPLKDFYKAYKKLDKTDGEILTKIRFKQPDGDWHFNFEKVSKRTYLDIASVNTAILLKTESGFITEAHLSMGGVSPIPLYLKQVSHFLLGKDSLSILSNFEDINAILQAEISPISDVRGSTDYKKLLARQLFKAHFVELFSI